MRPSTQVVHRPSLARGRVVFTALFGVLLTFGLAAPVVASGEPPVALDQSETTLVSTPVDIFLQATDNEDDILTYVIVGNPSHGTIGGPDCADAAVCTYTPTSGYVGGDSFTWKANDGTSDSNVATVTITVTPLTSHKILSAGPLTRIEITNDLNCAVDHTGDSAPEFYGDTACGTLVAVGGTLYGPADIPAGESASPRTPFTPVSQTGVLGAGTVGDPYRIVTVVDHRDDGSPVDRDRHLCRRPGDLPHRRPDREQRGNAHSTPSCIEPATATCRTPTAGSAPPMARPGRSAVSPASTTVRATSCRARGSSSGTRSRREVPTTKSVYIVRVGEDRVPDAVRQQLRTVLDLHRQRRRAQLERDHPGRRFGHPFASHGLLAARDRPVDHDQDGRSSVRHSRTERQLHDHRSRTRTPRPRRSRRSPIRCPPGSPTRQAPRAEPRPRIPASPARS